jgi:uncharacterized protein (TIGR00730 family)
MRIHTNGRQAVLEHSLISNNGKPDGTPPVIHKRPLITVFGSSQSNPGSRLYADSFKLGRLLGAAGFDLMTGGYKGVMEAVSSGAHQAGAHVIGITMRRFEDRVNRYVMDEIRTATFYERFGWLVDRADGYIAMHGGIGTLAEVTFTWQELQLQMVPPRPLVLVGERWRRLFQSFRAHLIRTPNIFDPMTLVATPKEALKVMSAHFASRGAGVTGPLPGDSGDHFAPMKRARRSASI